MELGSVAARLLWHDDIPRGGSQLDTRIIPEGPALQAESKSEVSCATKVTRLRDGSMAMAIRHWVPSQPRVHCGVLFGLGFVRYSAQTVAGPAESGKPCKAEIL